MESIDDFEEIYTYNSLEEREKTGEFDTPNLKQKFDFDLVCKHFIESSKALDILTKITPDKMVDLVHNNVNYKDFLHHYEGSRYEYAMDAGYGQTDDLYAQFSIIYDENTNSHFEFIDNTDVLNVISEEEIKEHTKMYFLDHNIEDFADTTDETMEQIDNMYMSLFDKMGTNFNDGDVFTRYNIVKDIYETDIKLNNYGKDDIIKLFLSPFDGIEKVSKNVIDVEHKILTKASYAEMLDEETSKIYPSIKKLYDYMYGENYFTSKEEFEDTVKNDFQHDFLTFNDDIKTNETYIWYLYDKEDYAIKALDSSSEVLEANEADKLFGVEEIKKTKSNEEEM